MFNKCMLGHKWGEWDKVGTCTLQRKCLRDGCSKTDSKPNHEFVFSHFDSDCNEVQKCAKCGAEEQGEQKHTWSSYNFFEDNCCTQRSICNRCGKVRYKEDVHEIYEQHSSYDCVIHTVCKRCDSRTVRSTSHQWKEAINTYASCLEYSLQQIDIQLKKLATIHSSLNSKDLDDSTRMNVLDRADVDIQIDNLNMKKSAVLAQKARVSNNGDLNAPARVCKICLFINRTGTRIDRISLKPNSVSFPGTDKEAAENKLVQTIKSISNQRDM